MGATPKKLRAAPPRRFENYILTRSTSPAVGLTNVPDNLFTPCSPGAAEVSFQDPGQGYVDDGLSVLIDVGFDFQIDNVVYKKFVACSNGWMALTDPTTGTFDSLEVLNTFFMGFIWSENSNIRSTFTSQAILLAPWFDQLYTVASDPQRFAGFYSDTKIERIRKGLETPPAIVSNARYGVKFFHDSRSSRGRRLIVRWDCMQPNFSSLLNTALRFEVVVYENGTIEYRYTPRQSINLALIPDSPGSATIGIFMPNGTNRFRDFSYGLGYRDGERQQYRYGGAVMTTSYTDTSDTVTAYYTNNLSPFVHWPGLDSAGGVYTFAPPKNRRRILPRAESAVAAARLRLPTVARTGDARTGDDRITFDDRRSVPFIDVLSSSGGLVNYPTTLQRFFGGTEPNVVARQDLFAGDFEFTASIAKAAVDQFILDDLPRSIEPFSEHKLFENDPLAAADAFFTSGSSLDTLGNGLQQSLRSKTQIRLSLPVNYNTVLFDTASSIYYYNRRAGAWEFPQNSSYVISNLGSTNDSGTPKGDMVPDLTSEAPFNRILEDQRGFGPIGNRLSSGSRNKSGNGDQTDSSIGSHYNVQNVTEALNKQYSKSITNNDDYRASADEVFSLPINKPFLIERAIIEVPLAAGDGWFQDKTTCVQTLENLTSGSFDFAGPGLTVALFNQTIIGNVSRRDLILTGTLTHANDNTSEIVFSAFPPFASTFQIRPRGYLAFGGVPGAIVTPVSASGTGQTFTGSVAIRCEAQVSNGVVARVELAMTSSDTVSNRSGVIDVFNASQITLKNQVTDHFSQSCYIAYINNFGRGGTGFDPSGRSVFGKEFTTPSELVTRGRVVNPFYLTGTNGAAVSPTFIGVPAEFSQSIQIGSTFKFELALPLENCQPSPYLVQPGDTLVLAISKTRPIFLGSQVPAPFTSGSIQHDVQLITGSINVVLYGSLLREGKEFHDTLNQPLASDAVHEIVVGNEPVLDQFESDYRDLYTGGIFDDYITGSLITKVRKPDGSTGFITGNYVTSGSTFVSNGSRGRAFSVNNARAQAPDGTGGFIVQLNESLAQRLQPWYERVGTVRVSQHFTSTERFWDSLMPAVNQCFLADGAGIFVMAPQTTLVSGSIGDPTRVNQSTGFLWFDYQSPLWSSNKLVDGIWTWSYPFEPRYSTVPRQQFIEKSFIANYEINYTTQTNPPTATAIPPRQLTGFLFGPVGSRIPSVPAVQHTRLANQEVTQSDGSYAGHNFHWTADVFLNSTLPGSGFILTSSAGITDTVKSLFGFGDLNNRIHTLFDPDSVVDANGAMTGKTYFGTTHWTDYRQRDSDNFNFGSKWGYSPIIRGWKYGVYSGLPTFSKAYFRQRCYGQFRDMLEQRLFTKFYQTDENDSSTENFQQGTTPACVSVKFVDAAGALTKPENTWSQNLSFEATSSVPYFDGETRNRQPINNDTLNSNIITLKANQFGQVTL